jgi:hypothetical protein
LGSFFKVRNLTRLTFLSGLEIAETIEERRKKKALPKGDWKGWMNFKNLDLTVCSYPKVAISEHFTVNQTETLIKAQSLI